MAGNLVQKIVRAGLDLLFPPLCLHCRAQVAQPGFCAACWSAIAFLDGPGCACCGLPFPVALEGENLCAACLVKLPAFGSARAILAYDDKSRGAILALKHADRLDMVPGFARWLSRGGSGLIALDNSESAVIPVPLHPRIRALGARPLQPSRRIGTAAGPRLETLAYAPSALLRSRATQSQGARSSAKARRRNVLKAFQVPDPSLVAGKRVLLLDDVLTTGATVEACARALKRAGAAKVHVLVLARVVKADGS